MLKTFKVLRTSSVSNDPFWEVFGPLLPQIQSNTVEILTKGSALASKKFDKFFFEVFEFYRKKDAPKLTIFGPTLNLRFNLKPAFQPKSKKIIVSAGKRQPLDYPNMSKSRLHLLSPFREKYVYFLQDLDYFCQETVGSQVKGLESNFDKIYFIHTIPVNLLLNREILTRIFKFGCFSQHHAYIFFFLKKRDFHIHNFLVPKVPSVYIGTKFTLKNHATTVHPLQCKTNFFIHLCF